MESNWEIGKEKQGKMREEEETSIHFDYPGPEDETLNRDRKHQPGKCSKALANIPT
ncbi:MAG TPA: hypothetical protein VEH06_09640 [Candidatus Bathyarchaeia archaeon]|nr:hypothetical protein [Candidatus Bathyarchaeia archaeon]